MAWIKLGTASTKVLGLGRREDLHPMPLTHYIVVLISM